MNTRKLYWLLTLIGIMVFLCWQNPLYSTSNPAEGRIVGKVTASSTGEALPGCNIIVRSQHGTFITGAATGKNGNYTIERIAAGVYTVEAGFIGYAKMSRTGVRVIGGKTAEINLSLSQTSLPGETVIISASRRSEKISDASASVEVLDAKAIERSQEPTLFGTMKNMKGIDYYETGLGQQQVHARGFVSPFAGNMLVLIDNRLTTMPGLGTTMPQIAPFSREDIYQVEMILGPSSALYGANATSGVINIITKGPKEFAGQNITFTAGEHNTLRLSARSSGMISGKLGYKVTAENYQAKDFESFIEHTAINPATGELISKQDEPDFDIDNRSFMGALYFYPNQTTRMSYSGGMVRSNFINQSNIGRLQVKDWDQWYHQLRLNLDSFFNLGSFFVQAYLTESRAGDTYSLDYLTQFMLAGLSKDEAMAKAVFIDKSKRYDLEMQHNFNFGDHHFFTWGAQWRRSKPNSGGTYLSDDETAIEIDESGLYLQYDNQMLENIRLTLTGRYDTHSDFDARFSPKAALVYRFQSHNFRITYNKAFTSVPIQPLYSKNFIMTHESGLEIWLRGCRNGFSFINLAGGELPAPIKPAEPLEAVSTEIGYKGIFANKLFLDLSYYHTYMKNFISSPVTINDPANGIFAVDNKGNMLQEITLTYLNYGEIPVDGFDIGAQLYLTNMLSLHGSFSYAKPGAFKKSLAGIDAPGYNAPEKKYKGGISYKNWWRAGTYTELSWRHIDSYFFTGAMYYNTGNIPTFNVVDLDVGIPLSFVKIAQTRLGISIKNILDNKHIEMPGTPELGRVATVHVAMQF